LQMETCAAGEGSSREGGTMTTLRSCRRARPETAGERRGRKGAAAPDLGDLPAEAEGAANPRKAGEKFGGREGWREVAGKVGEVGGSWDAGGGGRRRTATAGGRIAGGSPRKRSFFPALS
jgi:hypothetical protein